VTASSAGVRSVDDALVEVLSPGQSIVLGQGYGEPRTLLAALGRHPELVEGSDVFVGMAIDPLPALPGAHLRTFFPSGPLGSEAALRDLDVHYRRQSLFELADDFASGRQPVDVVLASGAPPSRTGVSLGVAIDYVAAAASRAAAVLLEASAHTPATGPLSLVAPGPAMHVVDAEQGPHLLERPASARDDALAAQVAPWIPDGATLQLGMGPWVGALCGHLAQRTGLRVHTGLISDWVMELDTGGALSPDVALGCGAGGSRAFYAWLHDNPRVSLASATVTHRPETLEALPALRAVNSVLEVDLGGQANTEIGANGRRGGVAGLADFAGGAARNPDGLSILALGAAHRTGSRIVPRLEGPAVSLTADQVEIVITEHGSADLRGRAPEERAEAIIAVADPAYRRQLRHAHQSLPTHP
jgi:acyl-CoA hydrolase